EDLFLRDPHVGSGVDKDGRLNEVTVCIIASTQTFATARQLSAALVLSDTDVAHDLFDSVRIDHWSNVRLRVRTVANPQASCLCDKLINELFVDFLVNDQARRRSTALPRRTEGAPNGAFNGEINIGIVHDDDCVLAAHLEGTDRVTFGAC